MVTLLARISSWMFGTLTSWTLLQDQERAPLISQPRSQGSLLPALRSLRSAGRREPWERGCLFPCIRASKMCLKLKYKACSLFLCTSEEHFFVSRTFRRSEKKARGGRWERKGRNEITAGVGSLCARHFVQLPLIISSGSL